MLLHQYLYIDILKLFQLIFHSIHIFLALRILAYYFTVHLNLLYCDHLPYVLQILWKLT